MRSLSENRYRKLHFDRLKASNLKSEEPVELAVQKTSSGYSRVKSNRKLKDTIDFYYYENLNF